MEEEQGPSARLHHSRGIQAYRGCWRKPPAGGGDFDGRLLPYAYLSFCFFTWQLTNNPDGRDGLGGVHDSVSPLKKPRGSCADIPSILICHHQTHGRSFSHQPHQDQLNPQTRLQRNLVLHLQHSLPPRFHRTRRFYDYSGKTNPIRSQLLPSGP